MSESVCHAVCRVFGTKLSSDCVLMICNMFCFYCRQKQYRHCVCIFVVHFFVCIYVNRNSLYYGGLCFLQADNVSKHCIGAS